MPTDENVMTRRERLSMLRPRLIAKRPFTLLLFAILAGMFAAATEPKLFDALLQPATHASLVLVATVTVVTEGVLLAIIWLTLESRYAVARQTHVASIVFLLLVVVASLLGFWTRMAILGDAAGHVRPFGPGAYTLREGLIALAVLTFTGTGFTTAHNLVFLRKADYTQFSHTRGELLAHVSEMAARFARNEPLIAADGVKLQRLAAAAAAALQTPFAAETGDYRKFVDKWIRSPLTAIGSICAMPDVQRAPDLFLRVCDLATPTDPWSPSEVGTMRDAYRKVDLAR